MLWTSTSPKVWCGVVRRFRRLESKTGLEQRHSSLGVRWATSCLPLRRGRILVVPTGKQTGSDPHGYNTGATPTVQEIENGEKDPPKRSAGGLAGILAGTLVPLIIIGVVFVGIRYFVSRTRWSSSNGIELDSDDDEEDDMTDDKDAETKPASHMDLGSCRS